MNFIIFGCFFSFRILNYVFREFFGDLKGGFFFFQYQRRGDFESMSLKENEGLKCWK